MPPDPVETEWACPFGMSGDTCTPLMLFDRCMCRQEQLLRSARDNLQVALDAMPPIASVVAPLRGPIVRAIELIDATLDDIAGPPVEQDDDP